MNTRWDFRPAPIEREETPRRDHDGGHIMEVRPIYNWDRTNTEKRAPASATTTSKSGSERKRKKAQNEPLSGSVQSAHSNLGNYNPVGQPVITSICCPHCNKVFETTWGRRPTMDEMRNEQQRVMTEHYCSETHKSRWRR